MLKEKNLIDKEKLLTLENISSSQEEEICMHKEQNLIIKPKLLSLENILYTQIPQAEEDHVLGKSHISVCD